jgi:hypothetical protein
VALIGGIFGLALRCMDPWRQRNFNSEWTLRRSISLRASHLTRCTSVSSATWFEYVRERILAVKICICALMEESGMFRISRFASRESILWKIRRRSSTPTDEIRINSRPYLFEMDERTRRSEIQPLKMLVHDKNRESDC